MISLAVTSVIGIAVALTIRPAGALPAPQRDIIEASVVVLCAIVIVVLTALIRPIRTAIVGILDRLVPATERAAIWLALTAWFPTLLIIAYFRAKATLPPAVVWIAFGFLDKRWETSACLLGALAPMLLLVAAARLLATGRRHPQAWRSWLADITSWRTATPDTPPAADTGRAGAGRIVRIGGGIFTALGLAYYFYGPPWYLNRPLGPIGYQEDVFLQGMQAMFRGHLAYIGPAAIQYGPGTQLFSYLFMRHLATFSVVGFRESWAMYQWIGSSVFFLALFLAFGYGRGLVAALMTTLIYPAQMLIGFGPGGGYTGYFGWANPLRYAGAISLIVLLPAVIRRCPAVRGLAGAAVLGMLWGGLSYLAQENLIAGAVGALAIGMLLLLSGTTSGRSVTTALLGVLAGFVLVWVPVLAVYATKGALTRFLHLYFFIPQAVASGYSNTPFGGTTHSAASYVTSRPWVHLFEILPIVLAVLALVSVVEFRPFRVAERWSRQRIMLAAVVLATILLYQGALLRSDLAHLTGTMLIFPALVIVAATTVPRLVWPRRASPQPASSWLRRSWQQVALVLTGAALFAVALLLLPAGLLTPSRIRSQFEVPHRDRQHLSAEPNPSSPATIAGQRVGPGLADAPTCCQFGTGSMAQFITLMDHIHAIVGSRTTYVVGFRNGYPGLIYFVADLNPAPIPADPYTLVFTQQQLTEYLQTFQSSVLPRTQALITPNLHRPEAVDFMHRYPHARRITLRYQGGPYFVLLSS